MADYDLDSELYRTAETTAELMTRPHNQASHEINGQAGFLDLALRLKVPIISKLRNVTVHGNSSIAGIGASATVANHEDVFTANLGSDFVNHIEEDWFEMSGHRTINLRYVTKKIRTDVDSTDAQHLASMVNEVRILASETLHQRHNVVRLFAISWLERSDRGRHWPQLLLQKADLGTLDSFVRSGPRNLQTKLMISLDMMHGLDALHDHGVTHCDLKPQNVLIFRDALRAANAELTTQAALDPVRAVLCDFGFSVIHSDFSPSASLQAGIGTCPWMAPEMETQAAVQLEHLHKADLYSFALTMASLLMDGRRPFADLDHESVTRIKLGEDENLTAAKQVEDELERHANLDPSHFMYISRILDDTLARRLEDRSDLQTLYDELSTIFSLTVAHGGYYVPDDEAVALVETLTLTDSEFACQEHADLCINSTFERWLVFFPDYETKSCNVIPPLPQSDPARKDDLVALDLPFERRWRSSHLPSVAAQQVIHNLLSQADDAENRPPDCLFALAGCFFNGSMTSRDPRRGLNYLKRAALAGLHDALMTAPNVFRSCGAILPGDLADAWASKVEDEHHGFTVSRALSIFEPEMHWRTHDSTMWKEGLADLWSSCERDSYDRYMTDRETLLGVAQMPVVWQLWRSPDGPVGDRDTFDHSRLPSFEASTKYRFLFDLDRERFRSDLMSYNFLELADTHSGLTILQRAICSTDEPMVKFLLDEYPADLENHGNTTGWTPLWLAFATGQLSIAQMLLARGANIHCRDETTGFALSHLVSRFASPSDIDRMVRHLVDNNGSNNCVNEPSQQQLTPLHMAFLISSTAHSHACRALLSCGADPTAQATYGDSFITPISQCVLRLDASLLEDMLNCPHLSRNFDPNLEERLARAKAQAYAHLISQRREFEMRIMSGNQWYESLSRIISLLVDEDMQRELIVLPGVIDSQDALDTAIGAAQGAVAQCLLDFLPSDYRPSAKCLARAIERKQNDLVQKLIERGAEIASVDPTTGRNAFHAAAMYNPQILTQLIEDLVGDHETSGALLSTKEFLQIPNRDGFHVAGLLLFEGADEQQEYAEALRRRFDLGFDYMTVPYLEDELQTMTATAIGNCIYGDFFPISV